jgi:hypothetical protein
MKKIYSIFYVISVVNLLCLAQTPLPYEKYLVQQYNNSLGTKIYYSSIQVVADNSKENVYAFVCQSGDLTYNSKIYTVSGSAGLLLQFKAATGEIMWSSNLGNQTVPLINIESTVKDPNGNICIVARGDFQSGTSLSLGSQTFTFRSDMKPNIVVATFNPSTHLWSKVRFVYAPDQQGVMITPNFDGSGNLYLCGTVTSSNLFIDNNQIVTAGTAGGLLIFAYKEDAQGALVYKKQTNLINPSYIQNVLFEVDDSENLYITGYISYITGAMSLDGVVVKNDTLSNAYDYSYSDIFLYKLNSTGAVQFAKTYLYSGNENPRYIHALSNGSLYLYGEYNGTMGNFPHTSGDQFYNRFIGNISGSNGAFNWVYPINCNIYYSDRYPYNMLADKNDNFYFTSGFCPNNISFMGSTFTKRNSKNGTSNTLCAKVSPSGTLVWGRVLGPVTTFETDYIDNPKVNSAEMGKSLFLQTSSLSYGTNTEFGWGVAAVPTTTMPGTMWGSMAVVNKYTGDIDYGYYQGYTTSIELDSLDYFVLRNNSSSWDVARYKANVPNYIKETAYDNNLIIYPIPVKDELLIRNMPASANSVEIYSIDGKMIMKLTVLENKVSVDRLTKGVYMLKINNSIVRFMKI